jgi:hypothetical protein
MSAQTQAALDDAIAAHVADRSDGAMLTGYILQTAALPSTAEELSETTYSTIFPGGQPFHVGLGLAHFLVQNCVLGDA